MGDQGLSVHGVHKRFGSASVLAGVDLDVAAGSTAALLGPSGSGKSTLLRIVAGLEHADRGVVCIAGDDVSSVAAHRRDVGFVFQDQALFPHLSVGDNVGFGLRMDGVGADERRRRVAETLELVGLPGREHRDPASLSGGEAQRVALARALAPRPRLLLLDEPLAALDQVLREHLLLELRSLFDHVGVTVVTVTHDPAEAAALGEQVAVLLDGRIAQTGPAGEVLARPVSAEVAGLVGHRNVARGTRRAGVVTSPWGDVPSPGPDGTVSVLVPPDAVAHAADGTLTGVVTGLIFRGGAPFAVVAGDTWAPLDVRAVPTWRVGDRVTLAIDAAAVHVMPA